MTSPDGLTWTAQAAAEQNQWISVTYGNGQFVAVSQNGTNPVMTSPDGITWTAQAAAEQNSWRSITYGNGQFVAVAADGTNRVMTSPDGVIWTPQAAAEANNWISVTYGDGLFVAVAFTGTNRVMTSPDGVSWTAQAASEQNSWISLTYANGQFVAVAQTGTNRVMTSGTIATLTLSGTATAHQDSNDVSDITFNFADSAFTNSTAAAVTNATGPASSNLGVDFNENILCPGGITTYTIAGGWDNGTPDATMTAIISENYDTSTIGLGDIIACELIVNEGATLTVAPANFANVVNDITVSGTLNVAHTGSVVQIREDAVTINNGNIAVAKTTPSIIARNFVAMSSPMDAETRDGVYGNSRAVFGIIPDNFIPFDLSDFPEFVDVENFLDDDNDYLSESTGSDPLPMAGIGQLVFPSPEHDAPMQAYDLDFTEGTLNSGTITVPIHYNGPATINNYNLLGNPYASAIDVTAFINANDAVNEVYYWDHLTNPTADLPGAGTSNFDMNDISMRNAMMGVGAVNMSTAPGQFMASGQGFGIKADDTERDLIANDGTGTPVVFTNSLRVTGNNDDFRTSEPLDGVDKLWLSLSTVAYEGAHSQAGIGFTENATQGFDPSYDSQRLGTFLSLFSTLETGEYLAIQGREVFDPAMEIAMGFSTTVEQETTYTINIDRLEGVNMEVTPIFLIDNLLNTTTNLKEAPYIFSSGRGIQPDRFIVVFEDRDVLGVEDGSFRESDISLYPNPASDILHLGNPQGISLSEMAIYDLTGRLIKSVSLQDMGTEKFVDIQELSSAIYMVVITSEQGQIAKQLIKE
jgi:hypothetical protein